MRYFKKVIIGGFVVLVPFPILYFAFMWLFEMVINLIEPLTSFLLKYVELPKIAADIAVLALILIAFFLVGNFVQTRIGKFIHEELEQNFLMKIPFYGTVKEVFAQVFGEGKFFACPVAIAEVFPETFGTVLITDEHDDMYTVFMPTAPNPTTGFLFHIPKNRVRIVPDTSKEVMFRTVISCGMGSRDILKKLISVQKTS